MSDIEKEKPGADEPAEAKKGGKKKIILIAVVILLVGGAGGGGYYFWRASAVAAAETASKKSSEKKAKKESDQEAAPAEPKKTSADGTDPLQNALPKDEDVKKIVELPPFIVNLADTEQARYLRMTVSLGIDEEEGANEKPDQLFITRVRNAMLAVLSDKRSDQILSVEGKTKLRKELLQAAQAASTSPEVKAIYITDFIVQL